MFIVQVSPVVQQTLHYLPPGIRTHFQSQLPRENAAQFSAAAAIHTVLNFVPLGTHYCWVDSDSVDSKLSQGISHERHCRNQTPDP